MNAIEAKRGTTKEEGHRFVVLGRDTSCVFRTGLETMKVIVVVLSLVLFAACVRGQDQGLGGRCVDKLETCDPNVNQITNRFEFRYSKQVKELIFTNTYVDISVR